MRQMILLLLAVCLLLSGCSLLDGSYHSAKPHQEPTNEAPSDNVTAYDYSSLYKALVAMTQNGTQSGIILVPRYDQSVISSDINRAIGEIKRTDPIAAYAVESIHCELGTNAGQSAVAVNITYLHDQSQIRKIRRVADAEQARAAIAEELDKCAAGVVLYIEQFEDLDFAQIAEDYAEYSPQTVMETPQVAVSVYPEEGSQRVVEMRFTYQTSRDALRNMQSQVAPVFESAALLVSGDMAQTEKFSQLYSFLMVLMEHYNYRVETSITPAYSLLRHGVGDAKAFATVYAAMCRQAGLEAGVINGTRQGEPWIWNVICLDGVYYHVDLLRCSKEGDFAMLRDDQMNGYVWDYSAYPVTE